MCGILIHKESFKPRYGIDHRGTESSEFSGMGYHFKHRTLPLQSISKNKEDYLQPMKINDNLFLLYNGEIFNFRRFGIHSSDLKYLVHLFRDGYHDGLLPEINRWDGFWSIVLVDTFNKQFTLFTDPLGKKQLYYSVNGICSEIKPLLTHGHKMNYGPECFGTIITPFSEVYRLLPGNIYKMDLFNNGVIPYVYKKNYFPLYTQTIKTDLYGMMDESIKLRMINKLDGITLLLSGGLDSTIILHHLLERGAKPELISVSNQEDSAFIKIVEKHYGVKTRMVDIDTRFTGRAVLSYEHPTDYGSLVPQYCMLRAATNTVVFTGDGADELFGGYSRAYISDTQQYDVFMELPFYHHIRLDRVGMAFTKEIRSPFLSTDIIKYALNMPIAFSLNKDREVVMKSDRIGKKILKDLYKGKLPDKIINRDKVPLRLDGIKTNKIETIFYDNTRSDDSFQPIGRPDAGYTIKEGKRLQRNRRPPGKL